LGILLELSDGTPWGIFALYGDNKPIARFLSDFIFPSLAKQIALEIEVEQFRTDTKAADKQSIDFLRDDTRIRDLFSSMKIGYVLLESIYESADAKIDFRYLEVNSEYENIIGLDRSQLFGKSLREMHPEIDEKLFELSISVLEFGKPVYHQIFSYRNEKLYTVWIYSPGKNRIAILFFDSTAPNSERSELFGHNFYLKENMISASVGSYKVDVVRNYWRSSKTFDEILGISDSYPRTVESWLNLLHLNEKDIPVAKSADAPDMNKMPYEKEYYVIRHTDGQVRYISDNGVQVYNENGDLAFIIGSILDITDRKSSEKALFESEQRFQAFMEQIPAIISIKDSNGRILYANKNFAELFEAKTWNRKTMYDLVGNDIADQMALDDMKVLKKRCILKIEKLILKNSEQFYLDTSIFAIPTNSSDLLIGRISFDISLKIRSESKLLESGRKLSSLMNNLPGMVYRGKNTSDREMEFISQGCLELTGYAVQDLLHHQNISYQDLIHPDDKEKVLQSIRAALAAKKHFTVTYRITDKNGEVKWVLEKGAGIFNDNGRLEYLEGFINDITGQKLIELALVESEERYRKFVENDISGDYITTPGGRLLYCNSTFLDIFGFPGFDEARNCNVANLFVDKTDRMLFLDKVKRNGKVIRHEVRMKSQTGQEKYLIENSIGEFDGQGILTKLHGYLIDVTEIKRFELELQLNQDRLNTLYSLNMQSFNSEQEIVNYVLAEIVHSTQSQTGYMHFLDPSCTEFQTLYWYNRDDKLLPLIIENNCPVSENEKWDHSHGIHAPWAFNKPEELTNLRGIPAKFPAFFRLAVVGIYDNNRLVAITGIGNKKPYYDESDLRQLDLFMNESWKIIKRRRIDAELQKLSMVVEQSPVSVVMTDINGTITYVNKKFMEISGYPFHEIIGQNSRILKTGYTTPEEYQNLWTTIRNGIVWTGELYNKKKNGDFFWESVLISPLKNSDGTIIGYAAVKEDITQRKQMMYELIKAKERAEEMNKIKDAFFANMSHELRTPMIGIMGFSEVIFDSTKDPETRAMLETIQNSAARLTQTLNLILEVSKLESQVREVVYSYVDVFHIIDTVKIQFEKETAKKKLDFVIHSPLPECKIETDEGMITQIITQLISNAIKYTNTGRVSVSVESDGVLVTLKITDTGIGIPKEKQSLIWQEFRQVSEGFSRKYEGIGLGLTVVKKFVELLKGDITLESEENKGTTFTVSIPVWKDKTMTSLMEPESGTVKSAPFSASHSGLPKILHIDDDPNMINVVARYLDGVCETDSTETGEEALEKVKHTQYDAILMDINLGPGQDGMEVTQLIRQFREYSEVPIIAVTAFAMSGDKEAFLSIGCSHYLAKPFRRNTLVSLLSEVLHIKVK
jgi:PAS domain S-box-containing protein